MHKCGRDGMHSSGAKCRSRLSACHFREPIPRLVKSLPISTSVDGQSNVLLIQERTGLWSWPGGKIEPDDDGPCAAMTRETWEEASLLIPESTWNLQGTESYPAMGLCLVFTGELNVSTLPVVKTTTDEHTLQAKWFSVKEAISLIMTPGALRFDTAYEDPFAVYLRHRFPEEWHESYGSTQEPSGRLHRRRVAYK